MTVSLCTDVGDTESVRRRGETGPQSDWREPCGRLRFGQCTTTGVGVQRRVGQCMTIDRDHCSVTRISGTEGAEEKINEQGHEPWYCPV